MASRQTGRSALLLSVLVLWAAGVGGGMQFAKIGLILPELGAVYGVSGASLGFLVSLLSAMGIVFGLFAGVLAQRFGARRLLLAAMALGAAMSLFQATLPALPWMLLSRLIEGFSHLAIVVAAPTLIGLIAPPRWRGAAMTLWGTFFGVAFTVAAAFVVPLAMERGVAASFLAHGIYMAVAGSLLVMLVPRDDIGRTAASPSFSLAGALQQHVIAYRSPHIAAPALGWVFYTFTFVALLSVLPTIVPPEDRAFTAAAMPLVTIITSMTLGIVLLKRFGAVTVVMVGLVGATAFAILLVVTGVSVWVCIVLMGALGLVQGASFAAIPQLNHSAADQALANGAMAQTGNLGTVSGTPLALAALGTGGLGAMIGLVVVSYCGGIAMHVWAARRRARVLAAT